MAVVTGKVETAHCTAPHVTLRAAARFTRVLLGGCCCAFSWSTRRVSAMLYEYIHHPKKSGQNLTRPRYPLT
jgi:hypothetical protein